MAVVATALAGALGGGAVATAVAGFVVRVATGAALSFLSRAIGPKPKGLETNVEANAGLLVNSDAPVAAHDIVYGRVRKGGTVVFRQATGVNNEFHHMILALAGHQVHAIDDIYINDEIVVLDGNGVVTSAPWNGKVRVRKHLGSPGQVADPIFMAETGQSAAFRGQGIAYLYVRFQNDKDIFAGGLPLITAVVRGREVYNPVNASTGFSSNAVLCIRDFITAPFGLNDSAVDDVSMSVGANISAEVVSLAGGGTEPRYELNGVIRADEPIGEVLERMLTACAGSLWWGQGAWRIKPGYYTPPVLNLTRDDIVSNIRTVPRANMRDTYSAVGGTFNDAAQNFIAVDYPRYTSAAFLADDGGKENVLDFELPMTTSAAMAQRLSKLALFRAREQITVSFEAGLKAVAVQVGDTITLTDSDYGWDAKPFEVIEWALIVGDQDGMRVSMVVRETSAEAYDWNADETQILANNTTLLSFDQTPDVGLSVTSQVLIIREKVSTVFNVEVTSAFATLVDRVEIQYRLSGQDWIGGPSGDLGMFQIPDVAPGVYDFRARAYNGLGIAGNWHVLPDIQAAEDTEPPAIVSGFAANVSGGTLHLTWDPVPDRDLSYYLIRYAPETTGGQWANATTLIPRVPRPATSVSTPLRPGTYMIRAVDKSGFQSEADTTVVVEVNVAPPYANTLQTEQGPAFAGAKTNCVVDIDDALRIDDVSAETPVGSYEFDQVLDLGAARQARLSVFVRGARLDDSAGLFDDLTGQFDELPGLFDDLTGFTQFADQTVDVYVSSTDDNPNASPVWSDYTKVTASDVFARAFRFRADLKSASPQVSPGVSSLIARLEYS